MNKKLYPLYLCALSLCAASRAIPDRTRGPGRTGSRCSGCCRSCGPGRGADIAGLHALDGGTARGKPEARELRRPGLR